MRRAVFANLPRLVVRVVALSFRALTGHQWSFTHPVTGRGQIRPAEKGHHGSEVIRGVRSQGISSDLPRKVTRGQNSEVM